MSNFLNIFLKNLIGQKITEEEYDDYVFDNKTVNYKQKELSSETKNEIYKNKKIIYEIQNNSKTIQPNDQLESASLRTPELGGHKSDCVFDNCEYNPELNKFICDTDPLESNNYLAIKKRKREEDMDIEEDNNEKEETTNTLTDIMINQMMDKMDQYYADLAEKTKFDYLGEDNIKKINEFLSDSNPCLTNDQMKEKQEQLTDDIFNAFFGTDFTNMVNNTIKTQPTKDYNKKTEYTDNSNNSVNTENNIMETENDITNFEMKPKSSMVSNIMMQPMSVDTMDTAVALENQGFE